MSLNTNQVTPQSPLQEAIKHGTSPRKGSAQLSRANLLADTARQHSGTFETSEWISTGQGARLRFASPAEGSSSPA